MTTEELRKILIEDHHTLVVFNHDALHAFDRRGVADLYTLLMGQPEVLRGALLADKVIGKGAAALMILGGVSEAHAEVISEPALTLFSSSPVVVTYARRVPHIVNRTDTGICPVESACRDCHTPEECLPAIESIVRQAMP